MCGAGYEVIDWVRSQKNREALREYGSTQSAKEYSPTIVHFSRPLGINYNGISFSSIEDYAMKSLQAIYRSATQIPITNNQPTFTYNKNNATAHMTTTLKPVQELENRRETLLGEIISMRAQGMYNPIITYTQ